MTITRRIALLAAALLFAPALALAAVPAVPAGAPAAPASGTPQMPTPTSEEITAFNADITVNADGTLKIAERIDYFFPDPKHGIYRDIPVEYKVDGREVYVPVTVESVKDNAGKGVTYVISKNGAYERIKIGDAGRTVTGGQTYIITYEVVGAVRSLADHDELYWNVTGDQWQVPIHRASATVRLPATVPTADIKTICYTGSTGSMAQNCLANSQGTSSYFIANDFLTVAVSFPKGLVASAVPPKFNPLLPWTPYIAVVVLAAIFYAVWSKRGRDPQPGTIVAEYDPPAGMSPAEMLYLVKQGLPNVAMSATVVDLAVRGYLTIKETEKAGFLTKKKDYEFVTDGKWAADQTLLPHERTLLGAMFNSQSGNSTLSALTADHSLYNAFNTMKTQVAGAVMKRGAFASNPTATRAAYVVGGIVVAYIGTGVINLFADSLSLHMSGTGASLFEINRWVARVIAFVVAFGFAWFMPRRTAAGNELYRKALGFKDYLVTAEKYRIQWQEKERIFEKFLPFAMAFAVADMWANAFKGMALPPPQWYQGSSMGGAFNPVLFSSQLGSSFSSGMSSAAMSAPQSSGGSGFGGGGGGGFGGGGGGSW